jgi:beta-glucosidase
MSEGTDVPSGFGPDFRWGVATASYQIEGAVTEDGRGPSVWDTFCAEPGRVKDGDTGEVACDHYHRWPEDVALMKDLEVDTYRFSIAWPRIQPEGTGAPNPAGLAFYDRLVDGLLEAGIRPCPTLFHWDTPQALEDRGGWLQRETAQRFADYATIVGEHLADRVDMWGTVNEPVVVTLYGYALGIHAPGRTLMYDALPAAHHLLLGHGLAVQALRAAGARNIGIASNHGPTRPASEASEDRDAATLYDDLVNWLFADPVLLGRYPASLAGLLPVQDGDLATISSPLDWFGLNHYFPQVVAAGAPAAAMPFELRMLDGPPRTDFGWPVLPDAFREILVTLRDRYGDALPPVYITENGCSYADGPGEDGRVRDERRIEFLDGYLRALRQAQDEGVDVRGYFQWSLLDNFEWAEGYSQRFGLVHVDYATQQRTPKDSFAWYREVVRASRSE